MENERITSGIDGLDSLIGGGFRKGSMILLAGNPGTGKTVFGSKFLCAGTKIPDGHGTYVSFAEDKQTFARNLSGLVSDEFEKNMASGKCEFLDFVAVKERGISTILDSILSAARKSWASRLVIDSQSAIVQAFDDPRDARIVTHTVLGKLTKETGCITLLIAEMPYGSKVIGTGIEEFVADGVMLLKASEFEGRLLRELELLKMRGTRLAERKALYSLEGGFRVFSPIQPIALSKVTRFRPVPDAAEDRFSSGVSQIDKILGGGYFRGSTMLFEIGEGVQNYEYYLPSFPVGINFFVNGRPATTIPAVGEDAKLVRDNLFRFGLSETEIDKLLRVYDIEKSDDIWKCLEEYNKMGMELTRSTGQPLISAIGVDSLFFRFGENDLDRALNQHVIETRRNGNLCFLSMKRGFPIPLYKRLSSSADMHVKIVKKHGITLWYGVKPRTCLHAVETDTSLGYPMPRLTPIV